MNIYENIKIIIPEYNHTFYNGKNSPFNFRLNINADNAYFKQWSNFNFSNLKTVYANSINCSLSCLTDYVQANGFAFSNSVVFESTINNINVLVPISYNNFSSRLSEAYGSTFTMNNGTLISAIFTNGSTISFGNCLIETHFLSAKPLVWSQGTSLFTTDDPTGYYRTIDINDFYENFNYLYFLININHYWFLIPKIKFMSQETFRLKDYRLNSWPFYFDDATCIQIRKNTDNKWQMNILNLVETAYFITFYGVNIYDI